MCSSPTDRRIMSGRTPAASCCAGSSWRCVVLAGWLTRVRVSPMLTRWLMKVALSMKRTPRASAASGPPSARTPKASSPEPPFICRRSSACWGCSGRPG